SSQAALRPYTSLFRSRPASIPKAPTGAAEQPVTSVWVVQRPGEPGYWGKPSPSSPSGGESPDSEGGGSPPAVPESSSSSVPGRRSEEHTSELQSRDNL